MELPLNDIFPVEISVKPARDRSHFIVQVPPGKISHRMYEIFDNKGIGVTGEDYDQSTGACQFRAPSMNNIIVWMKFYSDRMRIEI